jgi:hypothetical protein
MSNPDSAEDPMAGASREDVLSALFANVVLQNANMALMCLGKTPHPETGEHIRDLEAARIFIDTLEMLEVKTKGNLDKREEGVLKQSLMSARLAFVEAASAEPSPRPAAQPEPAAPPAPEAKPAEGAAPSQPEPGGPPQPDPEADARKKFVKKY